MTVNNNILNLPHDALVEICSHLSPREQGNFILAGGKKVQKARENYRALVPHNLGILETDPKKRDEEVKTIYKEIADVFGNEEIKNKPLLTLFKKYQNQIEQDRLGFINAIQLANNGVLFNTIDEAEEWLEKPESKKILSDVKRLDLSSLSTSGQQNLKVDKTKFKSIPGDILEKLTNLNSINLYNNDLKTLPEEFLNLKFLFPKGIDCRDNPITKPLPVHIRNLLQDGYLNINKEMKNFLHLTAHNIFPTECFPKNNNNKHIIKKEEK